MDNSTLNESDSKCRKQILVALTYSAFYLWNIVACSLVTAAAINVYKASTNAKYSFYILLTNLLLSDLFYFFLYFTAFLPQNFTCKKIFRDEVSEIIGNLRTASFVALNTNTWLISMNRFLAICFTNYCQKVFSRRNTFLLCAAAWSIGLLSVTANNLVGCSSSIVWYEGDAWISAYNSHINRQQITQFPHFDRYFETTFNCLVSTVYNPVCVTNAMVPDIIKNLQKSQFHGVEIISIDTEQLSGLRYAALKNVVFEKRLLTHSNKMYARLIHEHLSDKAVRDKDLDMYNIPANKLPFSSRATFYMWQEAMKRYICHIDQEAAHSHCSYQKINHDIVLCIDPFPSRFRNHVVVNWANKPKHSVRNPKKTREEGEKEEYKQYSITNDIQREWKPILI
uniref:G-protein coupled receptors family 1 profile domain-containing protein n=1 Tax=Romanomermis culicivorax TaxID=13658 RepID=A0A915IBU7_ROMCU